ncbi:hypothetical protein [Deinococcus multiflagellatus]|uniref:DUF3168 domain-containing protein n=1 Tax=Deinococcus multiflagellatus TaxID=1656887 RepID=A0ABW1ZEU2_9DEIO|nr:hypothetical protein [Deinococcus multiflagellatus]MBZ9712180.1 hypothetical protein [Deinococcus multiflagellatus]
MKPLSVIAALEDQLRELLPQYSVLARPPVESELAPGQIWVTTESIEPADGQTADQGQTTRLRVPVFVVMVMDVPNSPEYARAGTARRLQVVQAVQRVCRDYEDPSALLLYQGEQLFVDEGFSVSGTRLDIEFSLDADEEAPE